VGFRPFVYRLAHDLNLTGWVQNCMGTVNIHIQGSTENITHFTSDLFAKKPPLAKPHIETNQLVDIESFSDFCILDSQQDDNSNVSIPVDLFLCNDCLNELNDASDRRFHYPFINCTQCGPRYTLISRLPYDRINTTMAEFELCSACRTE